MFTSHEHCTFRVQGITQYLLLSTALNLGNVLKTDMKMGFNVLDQGFFQNHELELSDVLINTRATLVQLQ